MNEMQGGMCRCPHHKIVPLAILLIGLLFLLQAFNVVTGSLVGILWPILVIIIGAVKLGSGSCKCCSRP